MTTHGTTTYRKGCRCPICRVAKKRADYNYWNGTMRKCITGGCNKPEAPGLQRGLCMSCYSKAKKLVESGKTTWEKLEEMELVLPLLSDPFTKAFNKLTKET